MFFINFLIFKDCTGMFLMFGVNEHFQNIQTYFLTVPREDFRSIYLFCFSKHLKGFVSYVQIRDYVLCVVSVIHIRM